MKQIYAAGGYVVDKKNNKLLLIKITHNNKTEISIPKGHIDKGEDALNTARREIAEETGYKNLKLIKKLPPDKYQYIAKNGQKINKIVYQFLFELVDDKQEEQNLDEYEKIKPIWVSLAKAQKIAEYDNVKETIKKIHHRYTNRTNSTN